MWKDNVFTHTKHKKGTGWIWLGSFLSGTVCLLFAAYHNQDYSCLVCPSASPHSYPEGVSHYIANSYCLKVIPCPSSIYINVYDLFNTMITSFMDNKELSDSDLRAIALLHQDTAAIIITLHRSIIISSCLYGNYCYTEQGSQ